MKDGFQVSFSFSEFALAAMLISVSACFVGYFYTHQPAEQVIVQAAPVSCPEPAQPTVIVVPAPQVNVEVPAPAPSVVPQPESQPPKVWDNENMPSADDPPTFRHDPLLTAQGK